MKTIHKYQLSLIRLQPIALPKNAEILHVAVQRGVLCIWAMVTVPKTDDDWTERWFEVFGTGDKISTDMGIDRQHIGTALDGNFVWHVFERLGV